MSAIVYRMGTLRCRAGVTVAYIADQAGAVLPFHAEVSYSPLYLYPR